MKPAVLIRALAQNPSLGVSYQIDKNESLFSSVECPDGSYLVVRQGALRVSALGPDGMSFGLSIMGENHVISQHCLSKLSGQSSVLCFKAMRETVVDVVEGKRWQTLCAEHEGLSQAVMQIQYEQIHAVQFHLSCLFQRCGIEKARFALNLYANGLGQSLPCGRTQIKVSRNELADWIGVTPDRIGRLLRELSNTGEVQLIGRYINVAQGITGN